ncbi:hypothetical protein BDY19DRAFT_942980 [Irpex rosettiformis]|uniref:Uncharacterized protein n=1 Tax=Irpex rosettiformis TaxID=378272 RepID=A0ACB8U5U4_9APHY|nr:hypothetical protein BDY19DRAFT_942980 [Irpex rosettiformis]
MKFPKLSSFFKRSQSDSAISSRLESTITPPPRPSSLSAVDDLVLPLDTSNPFASELLAAGNLVQTPSVDLSSANSSSIGTVSAKGTASDVSCASSGHISAASHTVVVEVLTRRIQELEEQRPHQDTNRSTTDDQSSGVTHQELRQLNNRLSSELSNVRLTLERTIEQLSVVQTKNDRLQALFDLPILVSVFQAVLSGDNPLDALIRSVKLAVSQASDSGTASGSNPWRTLLEPVVGPRSPEDYIAQVNCTLRARRESRDWRKRAIFWKGHAREDGRHQETVTPSSSQLSDIVLQGAVCLPRANHVQDIADNKSTATRNSILVERTIEVHDPDFPAKMQVPIVSSIEQVSPSGSSSNVEARISVHSSIAAGNITTGHCDEQLPALGLSRIISSFERHQVASRSDVDVFAPVQNDTTSTHHLYGNLPPLASVTFRESYSIRSISSKKDRPEAGNLSSSPTKAGNAHRRSRISMQSNAPSSQVIGHGRREAEPGHSTSVSKNSVIELSVSANSVLAPVSELSAEVEVERVSTPPAPESTVSSTSSTDETCSPSRSRPTSSDFSFGSGSWEHLSTFINKSFSLFAADTSLPARSTALIAKDLDASCSPVATKTSPPQTDPTHEPKSTHTNTSQTASQSTSTTSTLTSTPTSSPIKKSRLPVMRKTKPKPRTTTTTSTVQSATAKFIKRLSKNISKPMLVDSTNVGVMDVRPTMTMNGPQGSPVKGRPRAGSGLRSPTSGGKKLGAVHGGKAGDRGVGGEVKRVNGKGVASV